MMPDLPRVVVVRVTVACACGEEHDFDKDELEDGARTELTCDCGRRVAVDAEVYAQYLPNGDEQERARTLARLDAYPEVADAPRED